MDTRPSREDLIAGIQDFADDIDSVPTVREMRSDGPYSPYYYKEEFGSWHDALRASGIQPTHGVHPDVDREELVAELRRLDENCDGAPRQRTLEEQGKYEYQLYTEEFDSFIHALEEADIEPSEKQYRFSSVETPEEKKGSANIQKLRENGPTPGDDLPQGRSTKDRELGIWKFEVTSGSTRSADPIYYLNDEHAPELVLRRFFSHNPHVLQYRDPHGIKMGIKNHQPSWADVGQDLVDELVDQGFADTSFENLVIVDVLSDETLQYVFRTSVSNQVDTATLGFVPEYHFGTRPIWGFPREQTDVWTELTEDDGLIFKTGPDRFTHYLPVEAITANQNVMKELWVEYDDNEIRAAGIEKPWPKLVIGKQVETFSLSEDELSEALDVGLTGDSVQWLSESDLESFKNSYGSFTTFLRNKDQPDQPQLAGLETDDLAVQEIVEILMGLDEDSLATLSSDSELEQIERQKRKEAFREGIYEIYSGCAICGQLTESPSGSLDLEAAHIVPKADGGPDVLQNGLGLCSKHHWAFDNGWFEISPEYEISVSDSPELEGYEDLAQYHGEKLYLPYDDQYSPHPRYLAQRLRIQQS
ncbi:HNH endonuclease (plasmid) [Halobacterium sp. NMX12-1]|uniref:HNH endonuclease n=1 Tax=Halobacterium sp. NMX12-1 TaxID=3166650 RepID=A0AAU8CI38_9EURY